MNKRLKTKFTILLPKFIIVLDVLCLNHYNVISSFVGLFCFPSL